MAPINLEKEIFDYVTGGRLENRYSFDFHFYFPEEGKAREAKSRLEALNFILKTEVEHDKNIEGQSKWSCRARACIIVKTACLKEMQLLFEKIAHECGGEFKGWSPWDDALSTACVALRIFGDSLVPELVSDLLGSSPTTARRKGEVIISKAGNRIAQTGSWILDGDLPKEADIEDQLVALLEAVTKDLKVWEQLQKDYQVDVFCGFFLDANRPGFDLSPKVTRMLAERGLRVGFSVYESGK